MHTLRIASDRRRGAAVLALAGVLGCGVVLHGQQVTEQALKAAFIYKIARFVQLPEDIVNASPTFSACVLGDDGLSGEFGRSLKDRTLMGHPVAVSLVTAAAPLRSCHLLYISNLPTRDLRQLLGPLRNAPILTIGDGEEFGRVGGIVQLFYEAGKLGFGVNPDAAKRAGVQLRANLLQIARPIKDEPVGAAK